MQVRYLVAIVGITALGVLAACGNAEQAVDDVAPASEVVDDSTVERGEPAADADASADAAEARALRAEQLALAAETRAADAEARSNRLDARVDHLRDRVRDLRADVDELTSELEEATASPAASTTTASPATVPPPTDPYLIPPGVIEDGMHVGFLVRVDVSSFAFDMAEILPDGSWKNENPKIRTLPVDPMLNSIRSAPPGAPIQLLVDQQHVVYVVWL